MDIAPFPSGIDRDAFGHWLSGFTDGEGCFYLGCYRSSRRYANKSPRVQFSISLRLDDIESLRSIQSYLGCGTVYTHERQTLRGNEKPVAKFMVVDISDLTKLVVPHFDAFPLRSKKKRDFAIWKRGVEIARTVWLRKLKPIRRGGCFRGGAAKWTDGELDNFETLVALIRETREYSTGVSKCEAVSLLRPRERFLFQ